MNSVPPQIVLDFLAHPDVALTGFAIGVLAVFLLIVLARRSA